MLPSCRLLLLVATACVLGTIPAQAAGQAKAVTPVGDAAIEHGIDGAVHHAFLGERLDHPRSAQRFQHGVAALIVVLLPQRLQLREGQLVVSAELVADVR